MNRILLACLTTLLAIGPLAAQTAGAGTGPALSSAAPVIGVGAHQLDARSVRLIGELGIRHVRHTLYWALWETDRHYRESFRADVARATEAGLELLIVVHQDPPGFRNRTALYRAFARFLEERVREFPQVGAWQLWNEMDLPTFTDAFGAREGLRLRQRGRLYGQMLELAYPAVKRANPQALVVTGGLASLPSAGFLDGLFDTGAPFDVIAIHTYGFPVRLPFVVRAQATIRVLEQRDRVAPLWNTEFGMEAAVIPPGYGRGTAEVDRHHLEAWRDPLLINDRERYFERSYGHVLLQDGDHSFDLVRGDGSLRPAATWLRQHLRDTR